jgi:lipopolysaccharide heptosyltransferase I
VKILIVKPSSLGDVAHAAALVPRLRALWPDCAIHWLCNSEYAPVPALAGVDRVWVFERQAWKHWHSMGRGIRNLLSLSTALRRERFDIVLDAQGLLRSAWFAWVTGAPRRIGFADAEVCARVFYSTRVRSAKDQVHAVDRCLALLAPLGDRATPARWAWPGLAADGAAVVARWNVEPGRYLLVVPGTRGLKKRWPARNFGLLAAHAWQRWRMPILITGVAAEAPLAELVRTTACANGCPPEAMRSAVGTCDLGQLACLLRHARAVIGGDTGPVHLADTLGATVIALMGPTTPARHGPYRQLHHVVSMALECQPCQDVNGPCAQSTGCMAQLPVAMVMAKLADVLE